MSEFHQELTYTTEIDFLEQSKRETGGGEGVQILKNETLKNNGQYTYKIYRVDNKIPNLVKAFLNPFFGKVYEFHEEAWNEFPYCKTIITNPGFEGFKVVIESMHISDSGQTPNALGHENDSVEILDIFQYV